MNHEPDETADPTRRSALETFAGTGAAPTDVPSSIGQADRAPVLTDVDVGDRASLGNETARIERARLTVTDLTFDGDAGLLASGRLKASGTDQRGATWIRNRPFRSVDLSVTPDDRDENERAEAALSIDFEPIDLGAYGTVELSGVPFDAGASRDPVASLLHAVAVLSDR